MPRSAAERISARHARAFRAQNEWYTDRRYAGWATSVGASQSMMEVAGLKRITHPWVRANLQGSPGRGVSPHRVAGPGQPPTPLWSQGPVLKRTYPDWSGQPSHVAALSVIGSVQPSTMQMRMEVPLCSQRPPRACARPGLLVGAHVGSLSGRHARGGVAARRRAGGRRQ